MNKIFLLLLLSPSLLEGSESERYIDIKTLFDSYEQFTTPTLLVADIKARKEAKKIIYIKKNYESMWSPSEKIFSLSPELQKIRNDIITFSEFSNYYYVADCSPNIEIDGLNECQELYRNIPIRKGKRAIQFLFTKKNFWKILLSRELNFFFLQERKGIEFLEKRKGNYVSLLSLRLRQKFIQKDHEIDIPIDIVLKIIDFSLPNLNDELVCGTMVKDENGWNPILDGFACSPLSGASTEWIQIKIISSPSSSTRLERTLLAYNLRRRLKTLNSFK